MNAVTSGSLAQSTALVSVPPNAQPDQQVGGYWVRGVGGSIETNANTTTTGTGFFGGGSFGGAVDCRTTTKQDFIGTQVGMDIGRANFSGGGNIHWGITAGYTEVKTDDATPGQGTFSSESQVPFAGVYMALSSGNWTIDAQVRGDFVSSEITDANEGAFDQPLTARSLAFLWNASYRFDLKNNWFLEPSIGAVSSIAEVNRFDVIGGINTAGVVTPSLSLPGSLLVDDIHSVTGRASLRFGTTIVSGTMAWQPFMTTSVFHEFADEIQARITTNDAVGGGANATTSVSRVGTFGHVGVGLAGVVLNSGWLGYARADYRFGDNIDSFTVNGGLRYQFTPNEIAAGMKDGGGAVSKPFNWTGLYAGTYSGGLWADQDQTFVSNGATSHPKMQGYLLGGQIGYNYQLGHMLIGVEADYGFTNTEGGMSCPNASQFSCVGAIDNLGLVTGRVGLVHNRAVYYVKGGLAFADVTAGFEQNGGGFSVLSALPSDSKTEMQTGWAFGAGMEFALTDTWTVKGEWIHFDLGSETFNTSCGTVVDCTMKASTQGDIARIGVNYHFGHRGHDYHHDPVK